MAFDLPWFPDWFYFRGMFALHLSLAIAPFVPIPSV